MERDGILRWYLRLRWLALFGQGSILLLAVLYFGLSLPWGLISTALILIPISSVFIKIGTHSKYSALPKLSETTLVGFLLVLDTLLLGVVLMLAGGPTNPFTIVFLLHVVLAAIMLTPSWTWGIAAVSSASFAALILWHLAVPEWEHHGSHHGFSLHLHGMLFAYISVASTVAYLLSQLMREVRKGERKLVRLENIASHQKRLASLTTVAAGAAHELSTPLSTMAVVVGELEGEVKKSAISKSALMEDLSVLRSELQRCKLILHQLSERTGDVLGESPTSIDAFVLIKEAIGPLEKFGVVSILGEEGIVLKNLPKKAVASVVRSVVKNALEASSKKGLPVEVDLAKEGRAIVITARDCGEGMDSEFVERLGEPFLSTKGVEQGMGLGIYLAKLTLDEIGGELEISSKRGVGTTVHIKIPQDILKFQSLKAA